MPKSPAQQLAEAQACFHSLRLSEAYAIFRRFFDRIPFKPETEHAQHIGMFARILLELGKEKELSFYEGALENHYARTSDPFVGYALATIYWYSNSPDKENIAKNIFEQILKTPQGSPLHSKTKMMLADCYQSVGDLNAAKCLIESIKTQEKHLNRLVIIWKALIAQKEGKYSTALSILDTTPFNPESDWYAYFSAGVIRAGTYIKMDQTKKALKVLESISHVFSQKNFKSVRLQLSALHRSIQEQSGPGTIVWQNNEAGFTLFHANNSLKLREDCHSDQLLRFLIETGRLDKKTMVKFLYSREYRPGSDDKIIYSMIHTLRKKLSSIGLPSETIKNDGKSYKLTATTRPIGGESAAA